MGRDRDTQRSRVYAAERSAWRWLDTPSSELLTIEQCQALVDKVLASKWLASQDDMKMQVSLVRRLGGVVVFAGTGNNATVEDRWGTSYGWYHRKMDTPSISLNRQGRQKSIVLHELAHILQPSGSAGHGWQFCSIYLRLVRHFIGNEAHDRLKAEFKACKVRSTKPRAKRTLTPEQREAATARLAAARAARTARTEED